MIHEMHTMHIQERYEAQPGNLAFDFSIPVTRNDRMCLVDIWKDRESFEAHLNCDVTQDWTDIKAKYTTDSWYTLYEGDRNDAYNDSIQNRRVITPGQ